MKVGYAIGYIFKRGSTTNPAAQNLGNGQKQSLPSPALARYDWFIEHTFLWPYYFASDRAWDLFNFLKRVSDRKTTASSEASSPNKPMAAADLEGVVAQK